MIYPHTNEIIIFSIDIFWCGNFSYLDRRFHEERGENALEKRLLVVLLAALVGAGVRPRHAQQAAVPVGLAPPLVQRHAPHEKGQHEDVQEEDAHRREKAERLERWHFLKKRRIFRTISYESAFQRAPFKRTHTKVKIVALAKYIYVHPYRTGECRKKVRTSVEGKLG